VSSRVLHLLQMLMDVRLQVLLSFLVVASSNFVGVVLLFPSSFVFDIIDTLLFFHLVHLFVVVGSDQFVSCQEFEPAHQVALLEFRTIWQSCRFEDT
jgi:hypothetical protein